MDEKNLLIEILMNHITSVTLYHDKEGGRTSQANIIFLQRFDELADKIISEGFSRRPELDEETLIELAQKYCRETYPYPSEEYEEKFGALIYFSKAICAKFTAPEAKQREVKWPEKVDLTGFKDGYGKGSRDHIIAAAWNQAIDACKKAYEEAQPSSPVNAELRSALEECISVMLENDEYGWSDDAIKQAEQALNSIKSGKDTKCS